MRFVAFSHPLYPVSVSFCGMAISLRRNSIILIFCDQGPDRPSHFVGQCDSDQHPRLPRYHTCEARFSGMDFLPVQFRRDIAPIISSLRISECPALEMRPSLSLPPDKNWRGTSPSQAAKSRPHWEFFTGGVKASTAKTVNGPTPGIACKRRAVSASAASAFIFLVRMSIRASSRRSDSADRGTRQGDRLAAVAKSLAELQPNP